jgi:hypothetical protein
VLSWKSKNHFADLIMGNNCVVCFSFTQQATNDCEILDVYFILLFQVLTELANLDWRSVPGGFATKGELIVPCYLGRTWQ